MFNSQNITKSSYAADELY